jgi:dinuclear metal center YbgI/SA1388 family protein
MIVSHHPLIFSGLKQITGKNDVQRCVAKAIKNDIAIYAAHTNLDNVPDGVNGKIAQKIGLINTQILIPKSNNLLKLVAYVPANKAEDVREALFVAGAGHIGNYESCSFNSNGIGTFKAKVGAQPFVGEIDKLHLEPETRIEVILPSFLKNQVVNALLKSHPYEEPAYDIIVLNNPLKEYGTGMIGELAKDEDSLEFLDRIKTVFNCKSIRYTEILKDKIKRVAICGGAGSLFLSNAIAAKADIYISGDFKYHDFFETQNRIIIADIGHFESEQFTKDIFYEIITKKMPTFAVQISDIKTNPINYL